MTRILLFAATNIAVLIVLSIVTKLLGLDAYLEAHGGSLTGLLWLSAIFGFGGAFISLALSKTMANFAMRVQLIDQPRNDAEACIQGNGVSRVFMSHPPIEERIAALQADARR